MKLKKFCSVPFPEKIFEQYEVKENCINANIGTDKIKDMMLNFIDMHNEWLFFILEVPTDLNDEPKDENGGLICEHNDVYYIDGCNQEKAKDILLDTGSLLIDDGMSAFGFGGHESKEEIFFGKFNVLSIYSTDTDKYESFLQSYGIHKTDKLITAWNTFTPENYVQCELNEVDNRNIYSIVDEYKKYGMYFAERRED